MRRVWAPAIAGAMLMAGVALAATRANWSAPVAVPRLAAAAAGDSQDVAAHLVLAADGRGFLAGDLQIPGESPRFDALGGASLAPDGSVGPAVEIARAPEDPYEVSLGIDARGRVSAGYVQGSARPPRVVVRTAGAGGRFGSPAPISPPGVRAGLIKLRVTPSGFAAAAIRVRRGRGTGAQVLVRAPGGAFHTAFSLGSPAGDDAVLAVADDGRVLLAWSRPAGRSLRVIEEREWTAAGLLPVTRVGLVRERGPAYIVAGLLAGGASVIAWESPTADRQRARLVVATRRAGAGRFSAPRFLTAERAPSDAGGLHVDQGGGLIVLSDEEADRHGRYIPTVRTFSVTSGLSGARRLTSGHDGFQLHAATNGSRVIAAWQGDGALAASSDDGGRTFTAPVRLSSPLREVVSTAGPYVAVDAAGDAVATWIDYDDRGDSLELARLPAPEAQAGR